MAILYARRLLTKSLGLDGNVLPTNAIMALVYGKASVKRSLGVKASKLALCLSRLRITAFRRLGVLELLRMTAVMRTEKLTMLLYSGTRLSIEAV